MTLPKKQSKTLPVKGRHYDIVTKDGEEYSNVEYTALINRKTGEESAPFFLTSSQCKIEEIKIEDVQSWVERN